MKLRLPFIIVLAGALFSGCQTKSEVIKDPAPKKAQIELELLHAGSRYPSELSDKKIRVLRSQSQYEDELMFYSSDNARDIDFTKNRVLLVDLGMKINGSFGLEIDRANTYETNNAIIVTVDNTKHGTGCNSLQTHYNPYGFYRIPVNNSGKVVLIRENWVEGKSCKNQ